MEHISDRSSVSVGIQGYNDKESVQQIISIVPYHGENITPLIEPGIVEDVRSDESSDIDYEWAKKCKRIYVLCRDKRLGRDSAHYAATRYASEGIFYHFFVDLPTDMTHLPSLIQRIRDGNGIVLGIRLQSDRSIIRSSEREPKHQICNSFVPFFLRNVITDILPGFKVFRRDKQLTHLPGIKEIHWFRDTGHLVCVMRNGNRIAVLPVIWNEMAGSTVRRTKPFSMTYSILELRFRLSRNLLHKEEQITRRSDKISISQYRIQKSLVHNTALL